MKKPFDATSRNLFEMNPADWSAYVAVRCPTPDGPA
jgi:hypothetical protein